MIGYLSGNLLAKNEETLQCVILSGEVGYEVTLHKRLFEELPTGERVALWIHTHMKESVFSMYGFRSEQERDLFRVVLGVSGLGPRGGLSLLGTHGVERLAQLILEKDAKEISTAPGIGKKIAERLVLEARAKIEKLSWLSKVRDAVGKAAPGEAADREEATLKDDLALALSHLGYQPTQYRPVLDRFCEANDPEADGFEVSLKKLLGELAGPRLRRELSQ